MKIHKILSGLMAVVIMTNACATETPVTLWSRAKSAVLNKKTALVAGASALVGGAVAAYRKSSRVQGFVNGNATKVAGFAQKQYQAVRVAAPLYYASAVKFAAAHPNFVLAGKVGAAVGLAGLVGYGIYSAYGKWTTTEQPCLSATPGAVIALKNTEIRLTLTLDGRVIDLTNPIEHSGCKFVDKNGKSFYLANRTIEQLIAGRPDRFDALENAARTPFNFKKTA